MSDILTPPRPDPWATSAPLEAMRDCADARIICLAPSVNLTPMGNTQVPVPYMVTDLGSHPETYTTTVNFTGQKVLLARSHTQHCHGDEAGTGGGVKSGTHGGICEPIGHAPQVRAQGSPVVRHLDQFYMNNRNTTGQAQFVRNTSKSPPPADNDPLPGSLKTVSAFSAAAAAAGFVDTSTTVARTALAPPLAPLPTLMEPLPTLPPLEPELPPPSTWVEGFGKWAVRLSAIGTAAIILLTPTSTSYLDDFVPQDAWEAQLLQQANRYMKQGYSGEQVRSYVKTNLEKHRAEKKQAQVATQPKASPSPGNVRISEEDERKKRCLVGPYSEIAPICNAQGQQAHHIVPDYTMRFGTRKEGIAGDNRIPGMPSFQAGMSICLTGNAKQPPITGDEPGDEEERQHWTAHQADEDIAASGQSNVPQGTLAIKKIVTISVKYAILAKPECAAEIKKAIKLQYPTPPTNLNALGRTTQSLPKGVALTALNKGATQQNWQNFIPHSQ